MEIPDLVCAGFPCQGTSSAGKRTGLEDDRSALWFQLVRVLRDLRPGFVFVENSAGLLAPGRGFDQVLGDLASIGYDAEWTTLEAGAVGAPHGRDRVFVLATHVSVSDAERDELRHFGKRYWQQHGFAGPAVAGHDSEAGPVADAGHNGRQGCREDHDPNGHHAPRRDSHRPHAWPPGPDETEKWERYDGARPGIRRGTFGAPRGLDARMRRRRIFHLGNSCSPQQGALALAILAMRQ